MKNLLATFLILTIAATSNAETVKSSKETVRVAHIDQVIRMVDKNQPGSSQQKINIVVTDSGMSTDVSPRYGVYLALASMAEMGNITADFVVTKQALKFVSAKRKAAGLYEVKYMNLQMKNVTATVDARQLLVDEAKARAKCGGNFCDSELNSEIKVTETID